MKSICNIGIQNHDGTHEYIMQASFTPETWVMDSTKKKVINFMYPVFGGMKKEIEGMIEMTLSLKDIIVGSKKEGIDFTFSRDDSINSFYVDRYGLRENGEIRTTSEFGEIFSKYQEAIK